jgi:hypothetical protein
LDSENGEFHVNNDGVYHFGFDRGALKTMLLRSGFEAVTDRTAAEVVKPGADGQARAFPVFLITGQRAP